MCALLVGLPAVRVVGVAEWLWLEVTIATDGQRPVCGCGGRVHGHGVREVRLVDLPVFGRSARLVWRKQRWRCTDCGRCWTDEDPEIASPRCALTTRAARWATLQVGAHGRSVSEVAKDLGCDWHTVMNAVVVFGEPLIDDPNRIGAVTAIGLDETLFARIGVFRTQLWSTQIVDVRRGQLLDVVEGRTAEGPCRWLADQPELEGLYDSKLRPNDPDVRALAPKTVLEIHLIIRGALNHAVERGILNRNVALVAQAPRLWSIPKHEAQAWTADQLAAFLRAAVGHRYFAAFWLAPNTGMRRSELLGLKWTDIDLDKATVSINRGLVAVGYGLHKSQGKTANSRRCINIDTTTVDILRAWRHWTAAEQAVTCAPSDHAFTTGDGEPVHPHSISQAFERIARNAGLPVIRFHDLRHTHATLLIKEGVPVKVVSERLGHATTAFTIETYQHVLPGMQADAAKQFGQLIDPSTDNSREKTRKNAA